MTTVVALMAVAHDYNDSETSARSSQQHRAQPVSYTGASGNLQNTVCNRAEDAKYLHGCPIHRLCEIVDVLLLRHRWHFTGPSIAHPQRALSPLCARWFSKCSNSSSAPLLYLKLRSNSGSSFSLNNSDGPATAPAQLYFQLLLLPARAPSKSLLPQGTALQPRRPDGSYTALRIDKCDKVHTTTPSANSQHNTPRNLFRIQIRPTACCFVINWPQSTSTMTQRVAAYCVFHGQPDTRQWPQPSLGQIDLLTAEFVGGSSSGVKLKVLFSDFGTDRISNI